MTDMASPQDSRKRKNSGDEGRGFNSDWEREFFFVDTDNGPQCLICEKYLSVYRKFNIKRHYETHEPELNQIESPADRDQKLRELKMAKELKTSTEGDELDVDDEVLREVSYLIALEIAKSAHSFSDGELIKRCMIRASSKLSPSVTDKYEQIPLSHQTISRRIKHMGDDIKQQLRDRAKNFVWYSLCLDESTDVTDTSQLSIFIRGVDQQMNITEELLDIIPMYGTTTAQDLFDSLESALKDIGLPWQKLCSVATDGAPAMLGVRSGLVKLIKLKCKSVGLKDDVIGIHCIIHRENLCAHNVKLRKVMETVVKTINSIRSSALSHRQFKSLVEDFGNSDVTDVSYYCEVRWLSRGVALKKFLTLLDEIATFMDIKGKPVPELRDEQFTCDLAFLVDMCGHLNVLNVMLQGGSKLVTDLFDSIKGFKQTLALYEAQLEEAKLDFFPHLKEIVERENASVECDFGDYVEVIKKLRTSFEERFADMESLDPMFNLFAVPFSVPANSAPDKYKIELMYLQNDRIIKEKYRNSETIVHFYESLCKERFPELCKLACRVVSMFGTTYLCESVFSLMKLTKSRVRASLNDESLSASLRLMCTNLTPNVQALCKRKGKVQ